MTSRLVIPTVVLATWLAGLRVEEIHLALLFVAPAVLLLALLLADRYPGEALIERLAHRRAPARRRRSAPFAPRRRAPRRLVPGGGLLLARSLAARPPPA